MATLEQACEFCQEKIRNVFDPDSGTRTLEVIAGDLLVSDCCFVRDEIRFLNNGRLIFIPEREKQEYCEEYFVICRKLTVVGGHKPGTLVPCGPDDPGSSYKLNNVITWKHRLSAAHTGADPNPFQAADGQSFGANLWNDQGQGNNGLDGGNGDQGQKGSVGQNGRSAPSLTLIALEVDMGLGDHLTIDFDGQVGGRGGRGQNGGDGGVGMGGREGKSDIAWPGKGCDRQPGSGGDGGNGGNGGDGGDAGDGGNAGDITVISTHENIVGTGIFLSGSITYVYDGGSGGVGGLGGFGGRGGFPGNPGFKTSECDNASAGSPGADGWPPPGIGPGSDANKGASGSAGSGGALDFKEVQEDTCASLIPVPIEVTGSLDPDVYCRGFSSPSIAEGSLVGQHLAQVAGASVAGLSNVSVTIKPSSTDAQLDLRFDIAGNSGTGPGDLVLTPVFGAPETLANALEIRRFEVLNVAPGSGGRGNDINVQITGSCFDPSAALKDVIVSGLGVVVYNILVVDSQNIQCVFSVGNLAPLGQRNVTVKTGPLQHTLTNAFTVTA